ncbi:MAG: alpha/beta fold hydrolase [Rhodospirillales bacterium]|nr:alpha/beta fold hydrolase [Rhodospirillales bacterium]QQS12535.1 MAG: alpha/beta fold hydrolase [Rhodospirillales bacterium]
MPITSRLIDVAGGRAKIRVYEGGDGAPLLFFHGAGGLMRDDPFLAALATKYRVYAPLLPGYEDSTGEERVRTMLDFALLGFDVVDALGLAKPMVLGLSMGGMIAAEMAALAPNEIERLCLVSSAGLWMDATPIPDLFALLPQELPGYLFHDVEAGKRLMTPSGDLNDIKFLADFMVMNARRLGMAGKILFPIPDRGLAERLYRIKARTLVIWGAEDKLIPPVYGEAFRKGINGARLVTIPRAGHLVGHEKPEDVLRALATLN